MYKIQMENRFCDVIMVSKKNIHAMKIVSMECDFIEVDEYEEMMGNCI